MTSITKHNRKEEGECDDTIWSCTQYVIIINISYHNIDKKNNNNNNNNNINNKKNNNNNKSNNDIIIIIVVIRIIKIMI